MAVLPISERAREGLGLLRDLSEEGFSKLRSEILKSPDAIPSNVDQLSELKTKQLVDVLRWMYWTRVGAEVSIAEFINDVCEALQEKKDLPAGVEPKFRERLNAILNIEPLNIAAKAEALYGEHANVYCGARILTDARPVFGSAVTEQPEACIITHTLKLDYHASQGRLEEFFIALASGDLSELKTAIDRAQAKEASLRRLLDKAGVRFIATVHGEGEGEEEWTA